ncbi:sigma-B regulation protein RsbU (phosphoserine phosphatase) [Cyclonatronum proteinivorum]|uniref:Sigma-B regulation protein RsbU (Phosphoserine phosphatase) n=1 Tax=Cyclonatronum proteinivorum TaxID=1457365 RepID=A0A345UIL8_9BACT|nr:fused response regulator/phosphatase [Cyclonatronum proteinivorum]AXJ00320.1 sigma-B regulation protein RsbU (phosphoserine phosphatase) [Cyclonatronum proteinivorum]
MTDTINPPDTETKKKVLLVDDEVAMQKLFGFALRKGGFEVLSASNGNEALEVLSETIPDAIVCDIMMPELDGFGLRNILKMSPELYEIPFLFLSAFNTEENIIKGIDLDADDFISKTDGSNVVVSKLKNVIRKREHIRSKLVGEMQAASHATGVLLDAPDPPEVPGYTIDHFHQSHEGIPGGDFIDYTDINENLLCVLGDVMGKRWKAWVFAHAYAAYVRSSLRVMTSGDDTENAGPAAILNRLNRVLFRDDQVNESTLALTLVMLEPEKGIVRVSNVMQYPLLHCHAADGTVTEVQPKSTTVLGIRPNAEFDELSVNLAPGDVIVAFTDGLSELFMSEDQAKGFRMVKECLEELFAERELSASLIVEELLKKAGVKLMRDDATLLFIRRDTV